MSFRTLYLVCLMVLPGTSLGQVFKCETPDGPVFTDRVCGASARQVELQENSAGLGVAPSYSDRVKLLEKRLEREQERYRGRLYRHRNRELERIDADIRALERRKARARDNLAGATLAAGLDQQIAALRAARYSLAASYWEQINEAELALGSHPR